MFPLPDDLDVCSRAVISGGTGFLGRALVRRLLAQGWKVCVLTRQPDEAVYRTLGASVAVVRLPPDASYGPAFVEAIAEFRPKAVFHFAAAQVARHSAAQLSDLLWTNVELGTYLLEAAIAVPGCVFVGAGTYWQYYAGTSEPDPVNLYAATKSAFDEICKYYANVRNLRQATLVLPDTYGPGDERGKILSKLIAAAVADSSIELTAGEQKLQYIHAEDVALAFESAALQLYEDILPSGRYFVPAPETYSLRQIATLLEGLVGRSLQAHWGVVPYPPRQIFEVNPQLARLPQWSAMVDLATGLKQLLGEDSARSDVVAGH